MNTSHSFTTNLVVIDPRPHDACRPGTTNMHHLKLHGSTQGVGVSLDGCATGEGDDEVIWIEHYEGKWVVHIWGDGHSADPTHKITIEKTRLAGYMMNQ